MKYLIWSHEHNAWWGWNEEGYTNEPILAGEYDQERADQICFKANRYLPEGSRPNEVCVPALALETFIQLGMRSAIRQWAWWKDGVQYVGSCGVTLERALEDLTNEKYYTE